MNALIDQTKSEIWGYCIERTAKRMKQVYQRMLKAAKTDITVDQWVVLQLLNEADGLSQLEIGEKTNKDAPTITRIIDLLCKKELCIREADPEDRRKFSICLTDQGKQKIKKVLPIVTDFRQKGWEGLTEKDLHQMMAILNKIYHNLEDKK